MPTIPTQIGLPSPRLKWPTLADQIVYHPIDLLDHGLGEDLCFDADFNSRHAASRDDKVLGCPGHHTGHQLTQCL